MYFEKKYKDECSKYAPTFLKKLVDENVLSEEFLVGWYEKDITLDRNCNFRDKNAEKKFRKLVTDFIEWLRNASEESACEEEATIQQEEPTEQPAAADSEAKDGEEKPQKSEAQLRAE